MSKMILCTDLNYGIGKNNSIPWHSSEDFKHFKNETDGKIVVMGFNTWKSLPKKPLPGRLNIVLLSREYNERTEVDTNPSVLFMNENTLPDIINNNPDCIVIGGSKLYNKAIHLVDEIVLSIIQNTHDCDTFFNIYKHGQHLDCNKVKKLNDGTVVHYFKIMRF